jgi:hypothetical protein
MSVAPFTDPQPDERPAAPQREPSIRHIAETVCATYGVDYRDLISARRTTSLVRPRQVAYWLARRHTRKSLPEVGRRLGGRDHTTVLHGIDRMEMRLAGDPGLRDEVACIEMALGVGAVAIDRLGHRHFVDRDVTQTVAAILDRGQATTVSIDELREMAMLVRSQLTPLVEREGARSEPEPPQRALTDLRQAVRAVIEAHLAWQSSRFSRGEEHAERRLTTVITAMKSTLESQI